MRLARIKRSNSGARALRRPLPFPREHRSNELPGTSGRSAFETLIRGEEERARRHGLPYSVVAFEHSGTRPDALARAAGLAAARLRSTDWIAPHGTTLGLLLPFTALQEALSVAEKIRSAAEVDGGAWTPSVRCSSPEPRVPAERRADAGRDERAPDQNGGALPTTPDVSWDERGVSFLLARELPRWKRAIDVVTAGIGLVLLAPLMLLIAALILVTSGRPVVFEQWRTGKGFRRFRMYKFRTMASEAGAGWGEVQHLNEMTGPLFKSSKDPRVLGFGKLLRKTSMDELPQLVNVLKGDMTLVGPRALSPEPTKYEPWQLRRFDVTPGIACTWQARQREEGDFDEWMRSDLRYVDRGPSIRGDLRLLLEIVWAVVCCRGSH